MKRKELEAMGLEKEQVDQIMTQNGADKAAIEACQKEHDFLFESSEPIKNPVGGTDGDPAPSGDEATTAAMRAVMGLPSESKGE